MEEEKRICTEDIHQKIKDEYKRYLKSIKILDTLIQDFPQIKPYELKNCLERFLLSKYNQTKDLNTLYDFDIAPEFTDKLVDEINNLLLTNKITKTYFYQEYKIDETKIDSLNYDEILRISIDEKISHIDILLNKVGKERTILNLLRYKSFLVGGQQWGIPAKLATILKSIGFEYEGFASPFNNRFDKYCSIFADDIDSMGSFFDADLSNGKWSINPPYTEYIMNRVLEKIKNVKSPISIVIPAWTDIPLYEFLQKNATFKINLRKRTYIYEDPSGKRITATFNSLYAILNMDVPADLRRQITDAWAV